MKNLIRTDLLKTTKSLGCIISIALIVFANAISSLIIFLAAGDDTKFTSQLGSFTDTVSGVFMINSVSAILFSVLVALSINVEFTTGTLKNIIGAGYTRVQQAVSKIIVVTIVAVVATALSLIPDLVVYAMYNKIGTFDSSMVAPLCFGLISTIVFVLFISALCFLLKSTAFVIIASVVITTGLNMVFATVQVPAVQEAGKFELINATSAVCKTVTTDNVLHFLVPVGIIVVLSVVCVMVYSKQETK